MYIHIDTWTYFVIYINISSSIIHYMIYTWSPGPKRRWTSGQTIGSWDRMHKPGLLASSFSSSWAASRSFCSVLRRHKISESHIREDSKLWHSQHSRRSHYYTVSAWLQATSCLLPMLLSSCQFLQLAELLHVSSIWRMNTAHDL